MAKHHVSATVNGDEVEFLELKNAGSVGLDLSGLRFTRGISFTFPNDAQLNASDIRQLNRSTGEWHSEVLL